MTGSVSSVYNRVLDECPLDAVSHLDRLSTDVNRYQGLARRLTWVILVHYMLKSYSHCTGYLQSQCYDGCVERNGLCPDASSMVVTRKPRLTAQRLRARRR